MIPVDLIKLVTAGDAAPGTVLCTADQGRPVFLIGCINTIGVILSLETFDLWQTSKTRTKRGFAMPVRLLVDRNTFTPNDAQLDDGVRLGNVMIHDGGWAIRGKGDGGGHWVQAGAAPSPGSRGFMVTNWQLVERIDGENGAVIAQSKSTAAAA